MILILLLISIPATFFLLLPGFYEPHDLHHVADIYEMFRSLESGQFPPRLGPDFTFGYGYPLFNFYYVLPFYLGSFYFWVTQNLTFSFELVFITTIFISVVSMYLFLKEFFNKWAALAGASLFLYTPYRAVQIYVRGAMGEAFALSLLPLVMYLISKLLKNPKNNKLLATTSLVLALFYISHNYFFIIVTPIIGSFVILVLISNKIALRKQVDTIKRLGLSVALSAGISAYWWLPAIVESRLVASQTPFNLIDHFPFIKQLILPSWGYGSSVWGPGDEISFQIGLVNLAIIAISLLILVSKKTSRSTLYLLSWGVIWFFISVFMMNIRSLPIWSFVPFTNFIQFPWRLLFLTTFFTAFLAGLVVNASKKHAKKLSIILIACSIIFTLQYFKPSQIFYKTDEQYLDRFFSNINYSEDYLLLPKWAESRPKTPPQKKVQIQEGELIKLTQIKSTHWIVQVKAENTTNVVFAKYYFPGWHTSLDGEEVNSFPSGENGNLTVSIPQGSHEVELIWQETTLRTTANLISLGSIIIGGSLYIDKKKPSTGQV